jgi:uncharacterized protein (DUF433 family)
MNWLDCSLIEIVPGRLSGVPVVKSSRVRPEDLLINREEGEEWLAEAYNLPAATVHLVLSFYDQHRSDLASSL